MDFFDRHKALIITTLIFLVLLLSMYNIKISNDNRKARETLIELNDLRAEKPEEKEVPEEKPETPQEPEQKRPNFETHQAFNQNREESKNVTSRLDEIFRKNAAQKAAQDEAADNNSGEFNIPRNPRKKTQKASEGNNTSKETSTRQGSLRNSSISYSLVGRNAVNIPNPIYTCDRAGKVVVNIRVNAQGAVTGTSINKGASSTTNECLTDMAQEYAAQARFSKLPGRTSQPGTITYQFQN